VLLAIDDPGGEPVAEEVAAAGVPSVVRLRVDAVQVVEAAGELKLGRVDDQVVVRPHEAVGVNAPFVPADRDDEEAQEEDAVGVVAEHELRVNCPCGHVKEAVREGRPEPARHRSKLAR
jgi:hypothetical protein